MRLGPRCRGGGWGGRSLLGGDVWHGAGEWGEAGFSLMQNVALTRYMDPLLPVVGPSMRGLLDQLRRFARQDETLLLSGPTGAGKSRLARWCHQQSPRCNQPFETLHLLGVPEELQPGELFGWRKGAFTGAAHDYPGGIARAEGGTLFLDEIDKLSLRAQAGLLQFLDERLYRPLGSTGRLRQADVRIIVGTNTDLLAAVRAGRFREDLHYRINVLPVRLPPLAERRDEIVPWAEYFLASRHRLRHPHGRVILSKAAIAHLENAPWPGNLRQLDNILRRAYALAIDEESGDCGAATLVIDGEHVQRAFVLEPNPSTEGEGLYVQLERLAHAFVRHCQHGTGEVCLKLDHADAFRSLALLAAVEQARDPVAALQRVGQTSTLRGRNHHRLLRRARRRVAELARALGHRLPEEEADDEP